MRILGATIFSSLIIIIYMIARSEHLSGAKNNKALKSYLERESKSNSTRKKDISKLDYVVLNLSTLAIDIAMKHNLEQLVNELNCFSSKKIINLSSYSNTDLKLMYGPANLDVLSEYDNNFTELIKLLNKIGDSLYDLEEYDGAASFYEYAIHIGSDITNTYVKLCTIYNTNNEAAKIKELKHKASKITSLSGPIILDKINHIKMENK